MSFQVFKAFKGFFKESKKSEPAAAHAPAKEPKKVEAKKP